MLDLLQILGVPFLGCILMSAILGYLGTHVLKREIIFVDIALAQVAAVGAIAAHILFKVQGESLLAYSFAMGAVFLVAAFYAAARRRIFQINLEAVIGISYAVAAAAALFLVGIAPGGHIHIQQVLSGSLLWTGCGDLLPATVVFSSAGIFFYIFRKPLIEISCDYQQALTKGINVIFWDFIFYIILGMVITFSVQIAGIVVVFAYLIIPGTISALFCLARSIRLFVIWIIAVLGSLGGLMFAYYLDFSIGPAIALFLGAELIIASVIAGFGRYFLRVSS